MENIKSEIRKASVGLDTHKEVERIRSMIRSKSIYTEQPIEEDLDMYYFSTPNHRNRKASVMENRSLQYHARSANQSMNQHQRPGEDDNDLEELYDRVEILPLQVGSRRRNR